MFKHTQQMVHTCFFQCILSELYVENSRDAGVVVKTEYTQPLVQLITQLVRSYYQTFVQKTYFGNRIHLLFSSEASVIISFKPDLYCCRRDGVVVKSSGCLIKEQCFGYIHKAFFLMS